MKTTWVSLTPSRSLLTLFSPWFTPRPYTAGMGCGQSCSFSLISPAIPWSFQGLQGLLLGFLSLTVFPSLSTTRQVLCYLSQALPEVLPLAKEFNCAPQRVCLSFQHEKSHNIAFPLIMTRRPCVSCGKSLITAPTLLES